jgi:hypothetical protein
MAGLDPAIHAFLCFKTWMPGSKFACKSISKLSQAKLLLGRRSSPEGYEKLIVFNDQNKR